MHHSFDIDTASQYGIDEAILIHHFQHWIKVNQRKKINFHDGKTWTYQTLEDIAAHFPYWNVDRVRTLLDLLCDGKTRHTKKSKVEGEKVLVRSNHNKKKFDRTVWYAFVDEGRWIKEETPNRDGVNAKSHMASTPDGSGANARPIPDTKTLNTKTDTIYPLPPEGKAAPAAKSDAVPSKPKAKKKQFPEEIQNLGNRFIETMIEGEPSWRPPADPDEILPTLQKMVEEGLKPDEIIETLQWALRDNVKKGTWEGWAKLLAQRRSWTYLNQKYPQIRSSMRVKEDRKFAPSSTGEYHKTEEFKAFKEGAL
jgi:hypothetical protein